MAGANQAGDFLVSFARSCAQSIPQPRSASDAARPPAGRRLRRRESLLDAQAALANRHILTSFTFPNQYAWDTDTSR